MLDKEPFYAVASGFVPGDTPGVGTFYPPNLLFSLFTRPAMAGTVWVLLHLAIAGIGMYLLLRRAHGPLVAAIGGVAWQTCGHRATRG